jgi:hypothetical protein
MPGAMELAETLAGIRKNRSVIKIKKKNQNEFLVVVRGKET